MLRIYDRALELVRLVAPLARAIGQKDRDLCDQLKSAMNSVTLNLAEGSHGIGGRRRVSYSIAMGSAREALACLETAVSWGYIDRVPEDVREGFRAILGTLHKVIHRAA